MAKILFTSDGSVFASHPAVQSPQPLPPGRWMFDSKTGELTRYEYGAGMQGFWSSLGGGFSSVGKWIGNNFGTIATLGIGVYAIRSGLPLGGGPVTNQQVGQAQAQAQADAAARAAAQAQLAPGLDLGTLLPIVLIAVVAFMVMGRGR